MDRVVVDNGSLSIVLDVTPQGGDNAGGEGGQVRGEVSPLLLRVDLSVPVVVVPEGRPPQLIHNTRLPGSFLIPRLIHSGFVYLMKMSPVHNVEIQIWMVNIPLVTLSTKILKFISR